MSDWTKMNTDELELQYSPSRWSLRMSADDVIRAHVAALKSGTEKARAVTQALIDVPYGEGDREKLDVYLPSSPSPGNMDLMVSQVRRSVASVIQQYSHISGLYLCGHSAGAHLAAMVLSTDWSEYDISPQIKGAVLVSGVYDLQPILSTYVNEPLKMNEEVALRNSPSHFLSQLKVSSTSCDIIVAVAQNDSPEFRRQSEEYFKALESAGLTVSFVDVPNTDHFSIIEQLVDEDYLLTQLLLKMMGKS
ncbi:kynurenine formamidase isoform X2 [Siphateles boraxobius]|uniref:kynurenine formamidase isoform X2 n=1 Tax=Siphateles boraxobius TaxID=180520 RepID=UPI004063663E